VSDELRVVIRDGLAGLDAAQDAVGQYLADGDCTPQAAFAVRLIIEELVTNAVKYGGGADGPARVVILVATEEDGGVLLRLEDNGQAFDPIAAPPVPLSPFLKDRPFGRMGLHLVKAMASDIRYERADGLNRLTLRVAARPDV
jgi:serine/threonine-protein kinase RsbW